MAGNIITGYIEGALTFDNEGNVEMLPFADKVGTATFRYASESLISETFSSQGIKGASDACPFREECSMELSSDNLAWSFLQACFNTLAEDSDRAARDQVSVVLSDTTGTEPSIVSTYTLTGIVVSALDSVYVADENGTQYTVTATVSGSDTEIEFDDDYTGQKVTISYVVAATGTGNLIKVGSGTKLGEIGLYGRFKGCPNNLLVAIPRAIIQSNVEMSVGDGAASAGLTATALRDNLGNFAYIERQ